MARGHEMASPDGRAALLDQFDNGSAAGHADQFDRGPAVKSTTASHRSSRRMLATKFLHEAIATGVNTRVPKHLAQNAAA